jgi:hypothetical protein
VANTLKPGSIEPGFFLADGFVLFLRGFEEDLFRVPDAAQRAAAFAA